MSKHTQTERFVKKGQNKTKKNNVAQGNPLCPIVGSYGLTSFLSSVRTNWQGASEFSTFLFFFYCAPRVCAHHRTNPLFGLIASISTMKQRIGDTASIDCGFLGTKDPNTNTAHQSSHRTMRTVWEGSPPAAAAA